MDIVDADDHLMDDLLKSNWRKRIQQNYHGTTDDMDNDGGTATPFGFGFGSGGGIDHDGFGRPLSDSSLQKLGSGGGIGPLHASAHSIDYDLFGPSSNRTRQGIGAGINGDGKSNDNSNADNSTSTHRNEKMFQVRTDFKEARKGWSSTPNTFSVARGTGNRKQQQRQQQHQQKDKQRGSGLDDDEWSSNSYHGRPTESMAPDIWNPPASAIARPRLPHRRRIGVRTRAARSRQSTETPKGIERVFIVQFAVDFRRFFSLIVAFNRVYTLSSCCSTECFLCLCGLPVAIPALDSLAGFRRLIGPSLTSTSALLGMSITAR